MATKTKAKKSVKGDALKAIEAAVGVLNAGNRRQSMPRTVAEFRAAAKEAGANHVNTFEPMRKGGPAVWASTDRGDCGATGCRCSPGLWVSFSAGGEGVTAHFGTDEDLVDDLGDVDLTDEEREQKATAKPFERGHFVSFDRADYKRWLTLMERCGL